MWDKERCKTRKPVKKSAVSSSSGQDTKEEESEEEDRSPKAIKSEGNYEPTLTDAQKELIHLVKEAFFNAMNDVKQQPNNVCDEL